MLLALLTKKYLIFTRNQHDAASDINQINISKSDRWDVTLDEDLVSGYDMFIRLQLLFLPNELWVHLWYKWQGMEPVQLTLLISHVKSSGS